MGVIAVAVKHLIAAGVTGQALVDAVDELEKSIHNKDLEQIELRRAKDRERKRMEKADSTLSTESTESTETPFPPLSPPLKKKEAKKKLPPPISPPNPRVTRAEFFGDDFEEFWRVYPSNGASKAKSLESWKKATDRPPPDELLRIVRLYADHCAESDTPVCHATTWLNQKRWTVDYENLLKLHRQKASADPYDAWKKTIGVEHVKQ